MREKLGVHCAVISGYAFKSTDLKNDDDIPVIKIGNISNGGNVVIDDDTQSVSSDFLRLDDKYHVKKNDILISLTGSHMNQPNSMVGRSCRSYDDKEYLLNQRAGKVLVNSNNTDPSYMYYLLSTQAMKGDIVNRAYGAANQVNVSPSDIMNIKWDFPELNLQKRMGNILEKYDSIIQKNRKRITILESFMEEIYKEWFIRFRFPGSEQTDFKEGLPTGWTVQRLGVFGVSIESGSRPSGGIDDTLTEGVPSLGAEAVKGLAEYDFNNEKLIPKLHYDKMKRGKNTGNDILIYKDGAYIGKVTLFRDSFPYDNYAINEHVFFLNANDSAYQNYLYFTLHQKAYFSVMQNLNRNAAQPGLSKLDMEKIKITIPDRKTIEKYNEIVEPILKTVFKIAKQSQRLKEERDILLPRVMSGKLVI